MSIILGLGLDNPNPNKDLAYPKEEPYVKKLNDQLHHW